VGRAPGAVGRRAVRGGARGDAARGRDDGRDDRRRREGARFRHKEPAGEPSRGARPQVRPGRLQAPARGGGEGQGQGPRGRRL
ncbi:MAG: hypothetical protein AVDCRST_MAG05-3267, partial [uncultured Rubrobacteraceae bacterium]